MTATADLVRALAVLAEPPGPEHRRIAAALDLPEPDAEGYAEVFLFQAYPYASVHLGDEGMLGGEARDRVAGFWRALGLVPPAEPDHLATLLGLYAALAESEVESEIPPPDAARAILRRSSRGALLWEHLLSWCPPYLARVADVGPPAYRAWADLLGRTLLDEAQRVGPPTTLPLALREAAGLPERSDPAAAWVTALLAPVRSGLILTRADLARGARGLDLGMRLGERAYILRAMLEQDPTSTAGWLADEAEIASGRHAGLPDALEPIRSFWRDRAAATADSLRSALVAGAA